MNRRMTILPLLVVAATASLECGSAPVRDVKPDRGYEITDQSLFVRMDRRTYGLQVWLRDGPVWASPADFEPAISMWLDGKEIRMPLGQAGSVEVLKGGGTGQRKIHLRLSRFPHPGAEEIIVDLVAALTVGKKEVAFEVIPTRDPGGRLFGADFPPPLVLPAGEEGYTVLPTMQGLLIPSGHPERLSYSDPWWPDPTPDPAEPWWGGAVFSRACTMAWFGAVRGKQAYLAIIETPYDATVDLSHPGGGPTKVRVRWRPSRGSLSYARRIRFALFEEADHTTLARRYREHARSAGYHRSLREKSEARPLVGDLKGVVLLRADFASLENPLLLTRAEKRVREKGIGRAILRLPLRSRIFSAETSGLWQGVATGLRDHKWIVAAHVDPFGWGASGGPRDPELAAWPSRQGSLEMMKRKKVIVGSSPEERGRRRQPDARAAAFTTWYGGYVRDGEVVCPTPQLDMLADALRRTALRGIPISAVHLGGLSRVPLFDCFHTNHILDKKTCAREIRSLMGKISDRGHIVYGDEPADYGLSMADLFDRAPYARSGGAKGAATGTPVPLVSLVYHDAAVMAWDLDTGSDETDREQFLHAALTGGIPALPLDGEGWLTRRRGSETERERRGREEKLVERAKTLTEIHRKIWDEDMVSHEFVSDDGKVQRTHFANGVEVEVNFGTGQVRLGGVEPF